MLKLGLQGNKFSNQSSAAFGRLCVETIYSRIFKYTNPSAAFGRLCVETSTLFVTFGGLFSAAFGRLCVETR